MKKKTISIVIPTKDKLSRLNVIVKALETQLSDNGEIIIVFDGCTKKTLVDFQRLTISTITRQVILDNNRGRAAARNAGIRSAEGELIIFIDDDRLPDKDFISRHIKAHQNGKYAVLGLRKDLRLDEHDIQRLIQSKGFYNNFTSFAKKGFLNFTEKMRRVIYKIPFMSLRSLNFVTGNLSVKKDDLVKVGLFDENFNGWGYEDVDLGYRLMKAGIKLKLEPGAVNYHIVHDINWSQLIYDEYKNYKYFIQKIRTDLFNYILARVYCSTVRFINMNTGRWTKVTTK